MVQQNKPSKPDWALRIKENLMLLSLLVTPTKRAVRIFYEMGSAHNYFTERSYYLNMGYWKNSPGTLDEACEAMARLLGESAKVGPGDRVLDVGFGFGDQDMFWMERFAPARIVGLNITSTQVEVARKRAAERGLADRIEFREGSATAMPFDSGSFDKVLALESAFHFVTREKFFHEAYRVLRPGGWIATADPIPLPDASRSAHGLRGWAQDYLRRSFLPAPRENMYTRDTYARKMAAAGFENVRTLSIRKHVFAPFTRYLAARIHDAEIVERVNPVLRQGWMAALKSKNGGNAMIDNFDYIIAVGEKPVQPPA